MWLQVKYIYNTFKIHFSIGHGSDYILIQLVDGGVSLTINQVYYLVVYFIFSYSLLLNLNLINSTSYKIILKNDKSIKF